MAVATRTGLVEDLIERYPDIPPEAVLKEDLLRTGIAFDEDRRAVVRDGCNLVLDERETLVRLVQEVLRHLLGRAVEPHLVQRHG